MLYNHTHTEIMAQKNVFTREVVYLSTQDLINARCQIDAELLDRKTLKKGKKLTKKEPVTLVFENIPRGYGTLEVYEIAREYGPINSVRWRVDENGDEMNDMFVVYRRREDAKKLYDKELYKTDKNKHPIFVDKVQVNQVGM